MAKTKLTILLFVILFPVVHLPVQSTVGDKSFVVVIDPGHGGKDYGAIGSASNEKSINLAVSLLVGDYIKKAYPDVTVMYTRKTDVFIELDQRSEIANKAKADLFISIHTNANRSKTPYGTETYTLGLARSDENLEVAKRENAVILLEDDYERKYEGFDPNSSESYIIFEFMQNKFVEQSIFLASKIQSEFTNSSKRHNRGVKQAGFLVLRTTGMPSVLIELGFISNKAEEKYLSSKAGQQQLAKSIVKAFGQYKADYDRKSGMSAQEQVPTADNDSAVTSTRSGNETSGQVIYKVQILSANKKLSTNAPELKGYKADYYVEKGLYKYTFGESSDFDEIVKIRKSLIKDFKDAFIIQFKDGVKIINK